MLLLLWFILGSLINFAKLDFYRWLWLPLEKFLKLHVALWVGLVIVQGLVHLLHVACWTPNASSKKCWTPNDALIYRSHWLLLAIIHMGLCICYMFVAVFSYALSVFLKGRGSETFYRWLLMKTKLFIGPLLLVFLLYSHTLKVKVIRWVVCVCVCISTFLFFWY